ncbi:rod-binding protein [Syntrophus sp. (in: bacteria)]|uniref:rod-binding protein n=1 Tax=Syntrophus sp. (in: bacteria) TaxID=48412 RepID=UPI00345ED727
MNDNGMNISTLHRKFTSPTNAENQMKNKEDHQLKKVCADFESLFVYNLLQTMRKTIPAGSPVTHSFGKDTYNMMFDQKIAEELSHKGSGMGLQTILYHQLKKQDIKNK